MADGEDTGGSPWVRIRGTWRRGTIIAWFKIDGQANAPWTCQVIIEPSSAPGAGRLCLQSFGYPADGRALGAGVSSG